MVPKILKDFSQWSHVYSAWLTVLLTGILIVVFVALSYRSPFSDRSLIGNLEPYPDTLYYSVPAWNLTHGGDFDMKYKEFEVKLETPPVYSLYLVPFFAIFDDVRSYYYANMLLGILSIIVLVKAFRKIFSGVYSIVLVSFLGFLYVSNYYIFTLPTLLMAENMTMFLLSLGLYFLSQDPSKKGLVAVPIVGLLLVLTKLSNLPLAVMFYLFAVGRLIQKKNRKLIKYFVYSSVSCLVVAFLYFTQSGFLTNHKNLEKEATFSLLNFKSGFTFYSKSLIGINTLFLWQQVRMILPVLVPFASVGLFVGAIVTRYRRVTLFIATTIGVLLVFMSLFPAKDSRYILILFPLFLISVGIAMHGISGMKYSRIIVGIGIIVIMWSSFLTLGGGYRIGEPGSITLKRQLGINFKHSETPWNYKAVEHFNSYFSKNGISKKNIVLATFLPPFYVNIFQKANYQYSPLSLSQEFFWYKNGLNKQMKIVSIDGHINNELQSGKDVYITNAYVGNLQNWITELDQIKRRFNAKLVSKGCLDTCNIYRLSAQAK